MKHQITSIMKKLLLASAACLCVAALSLNAGEKEKTKPTSEQKALRKEIASKYDANKDGKLDKEERAKISKEDREKMEKAGLGHKKKDKAS